MRFGFYLSLCACLVLLFFCYCNKSLIHHVKISGFIINAFTKKPVIGGVSLVTDSGKEKSVGLVNGKTNQEGRFMLRSPRAKSGAYYINYPGIDDYKSINVPGNNDTELGTLFTEYEIFIFKISLIPDSGKCLRNYKDNTIVPAGAYSTLIYSSLRYWPDTSAFLFHYRTYDCQYSSSGPFYTLKIPVAYSDTIRFSIKY